MSLLDKASAASLTRESIRELQELLAEVQVDAASFAELRARGGCVEPLALAAILQGQVVEIDWVAPGFAFLENPISTVRLVAHTQGDAIEALLKELESGRLSWERESLSLYLCSILEPGEEQRKRIVRSLRTLGRQALSGVSSLLVAMAARVLDDEFLNQVVSNRVWMNDTPAAERMAESVLEILEGSVLEGIPEKALKTVSGFTVRRSVEKLGRNEPCHCGSGKKYKKCCLKADQERLSDPSPVAGVTMSECKEDYAGHLSAEAIQELPAREMASLDFPKLDDSTLARVAHKLALHSIWEPAIRATDEMLTRPGCDPGHREDLIHALLQAGELELAEAQVKLLAEVPEDLKFDLNMASGRATLAEVEQQAHQGLLDDNLVDLAYTLLDYSPALGILAARAAISPERYLDSLTLLQVVEEARDRLDLPPEDTAHHLFDALLDERLDDSEQRALDQGLNKLAEETQELRHKLAQSSTQAQTLRAKLSAYEEKLNAHSETTEPKPAPQKAEYDQETLRLRQKVQELKGLIREGNLKRQELREQVKSLSSPSLDEEDPTEETNAIEEVEETGTWPPLLPRFTSRGEAALRAQNPGLARRALARIGELCSGSASAMSQVKVMKSQPELRSCRVGRSHRLLVSPKPVDGFLEILDLVHRKDLESALKRVQSRRSE